MKKSISIIFVFACLSFNGTSQTVSRDGKTTFYNRNSLKLQYGLFYPMKSQYRNPIGATFNTSFTNPRQVISIGREHPRGYGIRNNCFESGISYFINQIVQTQDSTKLKISAFNVYLNYKFDLFPKSKILDLYVGFAGILGSQILIVDKGKREMYRNFYSTIAPKTELRIQLVDRVSIGSEFSFYYDLTNTNWKTFGSGKRFIDYSKFTGSLINIFVGWCWD